MHVYHALTALCFAVLCNTVTGQINEISYNGAAAAANFDGNGATCTGVMALTDGQAFSMLRPGPNSFCVWNVNCPAGTTITMSITYFNLLEGDTLTTMTTNADLDGFMAQYGIPADDEHTFTGDLVPTQANSMGSDELSDLVLQLQTDGSGTSQGFSGTVTCVPIPGSDPPPPPPSSSHSSEPSSEPSYNNSSSSEPSSSSSSSSSTSPSSPPPPPATSSASTTSTTAGIVLLCAITFGL